MVEVMKWINGMEGRWFKQPAAWRSASAHLVLSAMGSEVLNQLGRIGSDDLGVLTGTVGAWWCFFAYKVREHMQEADGLEFQREDLAGPLANAGAWSCLLVLWIYYWLIGG